MAIQLNFTDPYGATHPAAYVRILRIFDDFVTDTRIADVGFYHTRDSAATKRPLSVVAYALGVVPPGPSRATAYATLMAHKDFSGGIEV